MPDWIKIDDKLPEEGQKVVYYFKKTGVDAGYFSNTKYNGLCFHGNNGWLCGNVTHWQPLPSPPGDTSSS